MPNSNPGVANQPQPYNPVGDQPSIQALVRQDLEERERVGIQRYGMPLKAFNGRDAKVDAYQEILDLACYLRQDIEEGNRTVAHLKEEVKQWLDSYELLRDKIIELFNPPDGEDAEEAIMMDALQRVHQFVLKRPCICSEDPCDRCWVLGRHNDERVDR